MLLIGCNSKKEAKTSEVENQKKITVDPSIDTSINSKVAEEQEFSVSPISHATMVLQWENSVIYVDPIGGVTAFEGYNVPKIILVTDIHEDHFSVETLEAVSGPETQIIMPQAVADKLPKDFKGKILVLKNGEKKQIKGFTIDAIPMYNLRKEVLKFHEKGRGNGYVIEKEERRVYISGDTEDISEMRNLKNIDIAFVCMNLPYTMTVESAADAVLDFKPNVVYPYHYRGTNGLSDIAKFKSIVEKDNKDIKVTQLNWYPENK